MSNEARRGTGPSVYRTLSPLTGRDGGGYGGDDGGKSRRLSFPEVRGSGGTWQPRRPQKPVGETPWGFESPLPHHLFLIRFIEANGAISQSHACGVPAGSGDAHAAPWRTPYALIRLRGEEVPLWVVMNPGSRPAAWMTPDGLKGVDLPEGEVLRRVTLF